MAKNEQVLLDSAAISAVFPHHTPLERVFLSFLLAGTASQLCRDYRPEHWVSRQVSERWVYMIPTAAETYPVRLSDNAPAITLSADAFGLAVTCTVLMHIASLEASEETISRFCGLQEYAGSHPEARLINPILDAEFKKDVINPLLTGITHH